MNFCKDCKHIVLGQIKFLDKYEYAQCAAHVSRLNKITAEVSYYYCSTIRSYKYSGKDNCPRYEQQSSVESIDNKLVTEDNCIQKVIKFFKFERK